MIVYDSLGGRCLNGDGFTEEKVEQALLIKLKLQSSSG